VVCVELRIGPIIKYGVPRIKTLKTILYPGLGHGFVWGRGRDRITEEVFDRLVGDMQEFFGQLMRARPTDALSPRIRLGPTLDEETQK